MFDAAAVDAIGRAIGLGAAEDAGAPDAAMEIGALDANVAAAAPGTDTHAGLSATTGGLGSVEGAGNAEVDTKRKRVWCLFLHFAQL